MPSRFTGLWRHPDFLRLWAGESISIFGSLIGGLALRFTAILWLDAGAVGLAVLAVCEAAPAFILGLVAGVWVDRLPRRPIMIAADVGRAMALGTVPLAAAFGALTLAHLAAVVAIASSLSVFFAVAYQAYLPTLVSREDLIEGNAKLTATSSVAEVGSFGISGWLVQLITAPGAVLADAVSFLFSAYFLMRIRTPEPPPAPVKERKHLVREAGYGVGVVLGNPFLRSFLAADLLVQFGSAMVGVSFLLYLSDDLGWDPGVLGLIFGVGGITSLFGVWLAGRSWVANALGPVLVATAFLRGIGALFMPLAGKPSAGSGALLVANQVVTDPSWTLYEIQEVSLRQAITPDHVLGRVNATMRFAGFGASLLGIAAAAIIGVAAGPREALFAGAASMGVSGFVILFSPVARLRRPPTEHGRLAASR